MNAIMNKTNNGKLIAAFVAIAMVVCAIAVIMPSDVNATANGTHYDVDLPTGAEEVTTFEELQAALADSKVTSIVIPAGTASFEIENNININKPLYIGKTVDANGVMGQNSEGKNVWVANDSTFRLTIPENVTVTISNAVYNNIGKNAATTPIVVEGTITFTGEGLLYSTCALETAESAKITGFFTNSNGNSVSTNGAIQYKHMYAADINDVAPYVNEVKYSDGTAADKAIYTYGSVSISEAPSNASDIALKVGGVGGSASTLTVPDEVDLVFSDVTIKEDSQANLYGTLTGTDGVTNNGKANILSSEASLTSGNGTVSGSGSIDTSAIMKDATLSGDLETSTPFGPNQTVTVTNNLNLLKNTILTIEGKLIIPEGVTVTIQDGAQLIIKGQTATVENNGTILVQSLTATGSEQSDKGGLVLVGGTFTNDGTIIAQYLPTTTPATDANDKDVIGILADAKLVNNGTVTIGTDSGINVAGTFTNTAGSMFTMTGTMSGDIDNAGTVDFNGRAATNVNINLTSTDAVANLISVISGEKAVFVTDDGYKSSTKTPFANEKDDVNTVILKGKEGFSAGGIVVKTTTYTKDVDGDGKDETYKGLDISGTLAVTAVTGTADSDSAVLRLGGDDLFINDSFSFGAGVTVKLGNASDNVSANKITVNGTMNVTANSGVAGTTGGAAALLIQKEGSETTSIVVTGEIVSLTNLHNNSTTGISMNAAMYSTIANAITTYHYTTLDKAVAAVADATTKVVDIFGNITVDGEVTITSGMTVRMNSTPNNSKMTISEDGNVTIANGGVLSTSGQKIVVEGSLYAEIARTGLTGVVASGDRTSYSIESEVYSTNGTDALYTNLVDAMAAAESGDVIELYSKGVHLKSTSFVIKDGVTVDTNEMDFIVEGSTLTINGTLFINDSTYTVKDLDAEYTQKSTITLNGYLKNTVEMTYSSTQDEFPAGAYYEITENGVPYYYITTVANAAPIIGNTENDTVTINGKIAMGTVSFAGVEDYLSHVIIADGAEVTSGNITLDYADLTVNTGAQFTGTVANAEGSVDVKMVNSDAGVAPGTATFTADYNEDGANVLTVTGQATGAEMTFSGNVTAGNMTVNKLTVEGTTTVVGPMTNVKTELSVNGTVNVTAGQLKVDGDSFVTGTVYAAVPSAESTDAGQAALGNLYVGIDKVEGKNDTFTLVAGTAGEVTGNVTADIAYVSTDSTVPEEMITGDDMLSTEFYVNDELWMTAYTDDAGENANVPNAPVTDARFIGWNDAEGETVYYANATGGQTGTDAIVVGSHDGKLYASIEYNVYDVIIIADNSIGSIAVDGVILAKDMNGYYTTTEPMIAGQHTVTYTLAAGYEGTVTLSSTNTEVSGMTFNLTGDFEETQYILTIGGATYAGSTVVVEGGNGGSDSLGLTDYLLIILVVLIVIMAIMVAMRLMRS